MRFPFNCTIAELNLLLGTCFPFCLVKVLRFTITILMFLEFRKANCLCANFTGHTLVKPHTCLFRRPIASGDTPR